MHRFVFHPRLALAGLLISCTLGVASAAPVCFSAAGKAKEDAQAIRLQADTLGWAVGVPASLTAGSFVKGKAAFYPKGNVVICLSDDFGALALRVQSSTDDDRNAAWHKLPAKRKAA